MAETKNSLPTWPYVDTLGYVKYLNINTQSQTVILLFCAVFLCSPSAAEPAISS